MESRNRYFSFLAAFLLLAAFSLPSVLAQDEGQGTVDLYLFWGDGCPHCAAEKVWLSEIAPEYPELEVHLFEIYHNASNVELFKKMAAAYGQDANGVPATFIGDELVIGFGSAETTGATISSYIEDCIEDGCQDPWEIMMGEGSGNADAPHGGSVVDVPFLGTIDAAQMSLPVLTIILGAADSFNPCAFFVLLFLLSMLIYAKSRKRMLLIGGTFIFFSGLIYFLFMAAWLNFFLLAGSIALITTIAGVVAIAIGGINIKDFFFFKKGVSLSLSDSAKPKLFDKMRGLLKADSLSSMMLGTIVLAITANTYELLCTAGFPMVYTRVLTLHGLSTMSYYAYLALYNIVYVIPLLIIVSIFTITLGAKKLSEWQGQVLKLMSGMMMLFLGGILVFEPALLNNVIVSGSLIAGAIVLTFIIVLITKGLKKKEKTD